MFILVSHPLHRILPLVMVVSRAPILASLVLLRYRFFLFFSFLDPIANISFFFLSQHRKVKAPPPSDSEANISDSDTDEVTFIMHASYNNIAKCLLRQTSVCFSFSLYLNDLLFLFDSLLCRLTTPVVLLLLLFRHPCLHRLLQLYLQGLFLSLTFW